MTSLIIVVAPDAGAKIAVFPTPSPPLLTGLPSVIVDELGLAPSVMVFPAEVIELVNGRLPPATELMTVNGPVNAKLLVPVNVIPELSLKMLPIVRVPVSALNCGGVVAKLRFTVPVPNGESLPSWILPAVPVLTWIVVGPV